MGVLVLVLARPRGEEDPREHLILASLTAVAAFALLGKVLSPQFLIWVPPLGVLAFAWRMHALAAAVAAATCSPSWSSPRTTSTSCEGEPAAVLLVGVRNAVLLARARLALRELQLRGHQDLLDRRRPSVVAGLD